MNNDIDNFISNIINDNSYQDIGNGIMLTNREIEVLNKRTIKKYSPGVFHTVVDIKVN